MNEKASSINGLMKLLNMEIVEASKTRVEMSMPITPDLYQPFNFVHGGATIALLESAASYAAEKNANLEVETVFGVNVNVNHRKSGKSGTLRGIAELERHEGAKYYWR
ncbi:MAG: PaaI family thioesterase, partial [Coriobacteriaceae bacterium]|nr:PaaI family thioesterase [Coriobacteriaceae bacterium]